jgi:hypothetical protein
MCMHINIYIHIHTYIYIYKYILIYAYMSIKNTVGESLYAGHSNIENFDEELSKAYMIS